MTELVIVIALVVACVLLAVSHPDTRARVVGVIVAFLTIAWLVFRRTPKEQDSPDVLTPPTPTTTPEDLTRLDDDITPPDSKIADHVDWADEAR